MTRNAIITALALTVTFGTGCNTQFESPENNVEVRLAELEAAVAALQTENDTLRAEVEANTATNEQQTVEIAGLDTGLETIEVQVSDLTLDVADNTDALEIVETRVASNGDRIDDLEQEIIRLDGQDIATNGRISVLETAIDHRLDSAETDIAALYEADEFIIGLVGDLEVDMLTRLDSLDDGFYANIQEVWTAVDDLNQRFSECACDGSNDTTLLTFRQIQHADKVTKGSYSKMGAMRVDTPMNVEIDSLVFTLTGDASLATTDFDGIPSAQDTFSSCSLHIGGIRVNGPTMVQSNGQVLFDDRVYIQSGVTDLELWCDLSDPGTMLSPTMWDARIASADDLELADQDGVYITPESVGMELPPLSERNSTVVIMNNGRLGFAFNGPVQQNVDPGDSDVLAMDLEVRADFESIDLRELVFEAYGNVEAIEYATLVFFNEEGQQVEISRPFSYVTGLATFPNLESFVDDYQVEDLKLLLEIAPWADPGDIYVELITNRVEAVGVNSYAFIPSTDIAPSTNIVSSAITVN